MGAYKDTADELEDTENMWGKVPSLMKVISRTLTVNDWPSLKKDGIDEINMERLRYLLSVDNLLEEMLSI